MGKSVNKVILLGRAGKDPEVHILRRGTLVNLTLATSDGYKDSRGEWQERTEWHNLVGFQRIGEILRDYVRKGSQIYIEGALRTRSWDERESGQRKFRTEVVVHEVSLTSLPRLRPFRRPAWRVNTTKLLTSTRRIARRVPWERWPGLPIFGGCFSAV